MSKYSIPEKEFIDFLIAQDKKGKDLKDLWDKKSVFLATIIQEYMAHLRAIFGSSHPKSYYKTGFGIAEHMTDYNDITIDAMKDLFSDADHSKKAFKLFLSPGYKPPVHPFGVLAHLIYLAGYYGLFAKELPLTMTSHIDLAAMKLVERAIGSIYYLEKIGSTGDRTKRGSQQKKKKKIDRKQVVLETFYKMDTKHLKLYRVGKIIEGRLTDPKGKKLVSTSTIERYLKEEGCF